MSDATMTAETGSTDPLKTAADAMAVAVQAAKDGASDARTRVSEAMPAIGQFLSRFTYTTFYTISYGVVFPTMLLVRAIPKDNCVVHGLVDGGGAARDAIMARGGLVHPASLDAEGGEPMQQTQES